MANKRLAHCVIEGEKQRKGVQLWKKTHHIKRRDGTSCCTWFTDAYFEINEML